MNHLDRQEFSPVCQPEKILGTRYECDMCEVEIKLGWCGMRKPGICPCCGKVMREWKKEGDGK